jgi:hypothetical protein
VTAIGLDPRPSPGDVELVQRCALGDELAGRELLARHRDAVADSGPSPAYESVDASGEQALAQLRDGSGSGLPFRVLWLTLHTQGGLPDDGERRNPVWDAFCALPLPAQTALWHREVEGQEATAIAALLGTSTDEVRRLLVSAYAAVRDRVEQSSPPSPSRGLASQLLLLQYSLRDVLAGVVLGPAAGRYLVARPRAGRRVPIEVTPAHRRRNAPYVALAAVVVGAVAGAMSFVGPAPVGSSVRPVPRAAPFEAPIVGSYLQVVAGTDGQDAPRQPASRAVATAGSSSGGSTANTGGTTSGEQTSAGPGAGPSGGGSPAPGGGSAPGGTNNGPDPAPANTGPGQGAQHASSQGLSNGVRAHGSGNKGGKSKAKGGNPGKSNSKGKGKGKAANRR